MDSIRLHFSEPPQMVHSSGTAFGKMHFFLNVLANG